MMPFSKWLRLRKKRSEPTPSKVTNDRDHEELDPDELDDLWTADELGITDKMRKIANSRNPKSQHSPEELEDLWNQLK